MSEWEETRVSEVLSEIAMGPFGSNIKVECFVQEGIPVLNGSNLVGFRLNDNSLRYVTPDKADSLGRANASKGDVVVTHRGTLGQIVYIPASSKHNRYVISQSQFRLRCNNRMIPEFFVYYFHSREGQNKLLSNASQVGVPALAQATTTFQNLTIPCPPLSTQRRIAAVLSALDDKIELNNRVNANLEAQAQALFRSWFVDFEPWGGEMPETWREGKLEEIAEIIMGQSPPGTALNEQHDGTPFFQGRAEFGTRYPFERLYTTETTRSALEGDVLLSVRAPVGDLNIAMSDCCIGRGLAALRSRFNHASFLFYLLKDMRPAFDVFDQQGTIFGCIGKKDLHGLDIVVPDGKTLDHFQQIAGPLDLKILINEMQNRTLASLRDALLPKLMRGEVDAEKVEVAG